LQQKLRRIKMKIRVVLYGVVLAVSMLVSSAAKADPVTLSCGSTPENRVGNGFIHFNESRETAGGGTAENPDYDTSATFSDTEIRWKVDRARPELGTDHYTYVLSRTTGELHQTLYNPNLRYGNGTSVSYCAPVKKQF
jgi:hypothetical protein